MAEPKIGKFIADAYRGVLMRPADEGGLSYHSSRFGGKPSFEMAADLLSSFLNSPERSTLEENIRERSFPHLIVPNVPGYSNIISIGTHCATAGSLKRMHLKKASYPFDWIFSSLGVVADCIEDGFQKFLDPKYHELVPVEKRMIPDANFCDHTYYRDEYGIKFMFNHRSVIQADDYLYHKRCVDRFSKVISGSERTILFCMADHKVAESDFERLSNILRNRDHIDLLILNISAESGFHSNIELKLMKGKDRLFEFTSMRGLGPVSMINDADEMMLREFLVDLPTPENSNAQH